MRQIRTFLVLTALAATSDCGDQASGQCVAAPKRVFSDELSMPREPTVALDSFTSAKQCGLCHENHYAEWSTSKHAYAMIDPVYRALVAVRQQDQRGEQDMACLQCHTAIGTRGGDIVPCFDFAKLQPITLEGVTCEGCHKVASLARPYNSGHVLDQDGPIRGPLADPLANPFHASEFSPLHSSSDFCAGCHDSRELSGLVLERPFDEWQGSPAAAAGVTCQTCHMPAYEGQAISGGPTRTLHRHRWLSVDLPLTDGFVPPEQEAELRAGAQALLAGAASVEITAAPSLRAGEALDLFVTVRNNIPAHNFPTGSTFNRQAWVEAIVRDGNGEILFATGTLDAAGDLSSRPEPILLSSVLLDHQHQPVLFAWRASEHLSNALPPLEDRVYTFAVPTSSATPGPLSVQARVLFRAFSPHMLRTLGLDEYVAKLEIHEVSRDSASVEVRPP